jgi:hypothetical protein
MLLIATLMIVFNSFSQTDTSKICLETPVAKEVVKDLLKGDECKEILIITNQNIAILESQISIKDAIIENKDAQIGFQKDMLTSKDKQLDVWENEYKKLQKKHKKLKFYNKVKTGVGIIIISGLTYLLVVKQ